MVWSTTWQPPQPPAFPPQANLPRPSEGPWEPWDSQVSRLCPWKRAVVGGDSLEEGAACQTRPGREARGGGAGPLTHCFCCLRNRSSELRAGQGPCLVPTPALLPEAKRKKREGEEEGLGGTEEEREDGGDTGALVSGNWRGRPRRGPGATPLLQGADVHLAVSDHHPQGLSQRCPKGTQRSPS